MDIITFVAMGIASWFIPQDFSPVIHTSSAYVCAMNSVSPGTRVEVENVNNGKETNCIVTGSGPCCGRVLDAAPAVRDALGFNGLATVRVYRVVKHIPFCHGYTQPSTCKPPSIPGYCVMDLPRPAVYDCKVDL